MKSIWQLDVFVDPPLRDRYIENSANPAIEKNPERPTDALHPLPANLRVPDMCIWHRSPYHLDGGADNGRERSGHDFMLPYWMGRHYGYINLISRKASEQVNDEDRATMQDLLGLDSLDGYNIYGGHEFLKSHADFTPQSLEDLWATKKSLKLRSGFYLLSYQVGDEKFILINGFHPAQLAHFTEADRRIVLVLLHSDTDWGTLRNDMVGATFPEKADPGSIRGSFYANAAQYGFESVSIANNCVHLSAGPYEGAVEIMNFLGNLFDLNPSEQPPLMFQKLQAKGQSLGDAKKVLDNPDVVVDGKTDDLFTATEDVNSDPAVKLWVNQ